MSDPRPLLFGLYEQACVGNGSSAASLWTHPADDRLSATSLRYWTDQARRVEDAGMDLFFFGDVLGLYDTYRGGAETAIRHGVEIPAPGSDAPHPRSGGGDRAPRVRDDGVHDVRASLRARATVLDARPPHRRAHRMERGDVVPAGAAANFGLDVMAHDSRYDRADEFLEVAYALWERSWDDDAFVGDKASGVFADPAKVHRIDHVGEHFRVAGPHLVTPSPQRTPVVIQAGWSPRGREFAARHAELIFVGDSDPVAVREGLAGIRRRAEELGRDASQIRAVVGMNLVVAPTEIAVQEKIDSLQAHYAAEAQLAAYAGWGGIDFSQYADDEPLVKRSTNATQTKETRSDAPVLTAGDVRRQFSKVTAFADDRFLGTPDTVADAVGAFVEESGVDGFLLHPFLSPGSVEDFSELLVPALRERGLYGGFPKDGTLRSRLRSDRRDRLGDDHPARAGAR